MIAFFARQRVFGVLAALFLCVTGISMFLLSPKESLPEIKLGIIVINTVYPNAAPQEVESLVTTPVEEAIKDVRGIREITSSSSDSVSVVVLRLEASVKDTQRVLDDVKAAIDRLAELPENSEKPQAFEVTTDEFPVINIQLSGGADYGQLREAAKKYTEGLSKIKGVSSVTKAGYLDRAIWVEADKKNFREYGLTIFNLINSIRNANLAVPAGNKTFDGEEYTIRAIAELKDAGDTANVIVRANEAGNYIRVRDTALVKDGFKEKTEIIRADMEPAIVLTVLKSRGEDSMRISKEARRLASEFEAAGSGEIKIRFTNDASVYIKDRLNVVNSNGVFGGLLVLGLLMLFIRPAIAFFTAAGIPVAFGASLIIVKIMGLSYDMLSLFGYVMVIGMLVDNSIVVSENIYRYLEKGFEKSNAVVKGASEVFVPAAASVMTTVASFLPLVFVSGVLGSFLRPIPTVIIITLIVSLLVSYFILPSQLASYISVKKSKTAARQEEWFKKISASYTGLLEKVISKKAVFLAVVAVLFFISVFLGSMKGLSFFSSETDRIDIELKADPSYSIGQTEMIVTGIEGRVKEALGQDMETIISSAGRQSPVSGPRKLPPI
ncbi:MAG TPA: efflux RND transporter permease subunit [bacterium]|nr:efflux RND transporter permease subunit [bacterium]